MKRKLILASLFFIFLFGVISVSRPNVALCAPRVKINIRKLKLSKNDNYTLRVYNAKRNQTIRFVSDDETIIALGEKKPKDRHTTVTALNVGNTVIRTYIYNRRGRLVRTLKTTVKVTPYAISIKFTRKKVKLYLGDSQKLLVIIKPNISQETPLFESSSPDVVSVNSKGVITSLTPGEASITATLLSSGQKVTCKVVSLPDKEEDGDLETDN